MTGEEKNIHKQLVQELKTGSYDAFNKLYNIYADMLYGFVLKLTKSPSSAEDILQDTFFKLWQVRNELSPELSFKSYLYTIARNFIINMLRKQIDSVTFETYIASEMYQNYSEDTIEDGLNYDDFCKKLNAAKQKLTKKQREIFHLSREEGYSISKIAQELNISEKTVKNQLTLALKIMKSELAYYFIFIFLK